LLVEFFLEAEQVRLASIDKLITHQVTLQLLNNFDTKLEVVCGMRVN
jgi:hypothetical protein